MFPGTQQGKQLLGKGIRELSLAKTFVSSKMALKVYPAPTSPGSLVQMQILIQQVQGGPEVCI